MKRFAVENREYFYYFFILSIFGLMSIGKGSVDFVYKIVFPFSMVCLMVKFFSTKYTVKEWFWMLLIGGLLFVNLLLNGERALILAFLAVVGAKDVNLERLFKIALWERIFLSAGTMILAACGLIPNQAFGSLPKYMNGEWQYFTLYCYGYKHPNHTYWDIFTIAVLIIVVYWKKIKWYHYIMLSIGMYIAYRIVVCRAGWYTWLAGMLILILYELIKNRPYKKIYLYMVSLIPVIMTVLSISGVMLYGSKGKIGALMELLNNCVTGRIELAQECKPDLFKVLIGHVPRVGEDLGYIHFIYNYGWGLFIILLIAFLRTLWKLIRCGEDYLCIAMAIMSGYLFGEIMALSVGWNILLIVVSIILFDNSNLEKVCFKKNP